MFTTEAGARSSASHVIVFLTDGGLNKEESVILEASLAKRASIEIIVVSVGTWFNRYMLSNIASYPSVSTWVEVSNISTILDYTNTVLNLVCNSKILHPYIIQ